LQKKDETNKAKQEEGRRKAEQTTAQHNQYKKRLQKKIKNKTNSRAGQNHQD